MTQSAAFCDFYDTPVAFHGEREGARPVDLTIECMVVEDSLQPLADAVAPSRDRAFSVTFPRLFWREPTPPQIGEWLCFKFSGEELHTKVAEVSHLPDGDFVLAAVWTPDRKGGPAWLK